MDVLGLYGVEPSCIETGVETWTGKAGFGALSDRAVGLGCETGKAGFGALCDRAVGLG